jgi:anti-sigma B factor antagonist
VDLKIETVREQDRVTVRLEGELDMLQAPEVSDTLTELVDSGVKDILVDLTELRFLDSSGLSALLGAHQAAEAQGGRLVLQSPNERIVRLVTITGLGDVFEITAPRDGEPSGSR